MENNEKEILRMISEDLRGCLNNMGLKPILTQISFRPYDREITIMISEGGMQYADKILTEKKKSDLSPTPTE